MSVHDSNDPIQLRIWLSSPRARLLVWREHVLLRRQLALLTGVRLLQIGLWGLDAGLLAHAGTLCQWRLGRGGERDADISFDGEHLPIASASVDALLLPHTLELAPRPHRLLRECDRVLNDRGQLIALGFESRSPWAWAQRVPRRDGRRFVRTAHFYSARRVSDWLRLLEFEPQRVLRYGVGFPFWGRHDSVPTIERGDWRYALAWSTQAYLIVARKRVAPLTRIRWRDKRKARSGQIGLAHHGARRVNSRR